MCVHAYALCENIYMCVCTYKCLQEVNLSVCLQEVNLSLCLQEVNLSVCRHRCIIKVYGYVCMFTNALHE